MGTILEFPTKPTEMPEHATWQELAASYRIWIRYWTHKDLLLEETMLFLECRDGLLHAYQKGGGRDSERFFWVGATGARQPSAESLLIGMAAGAGGWFEDE